jgi:hypothetical protein
MTHRDAAESRNPPARMRLPSGKVLVAGAIFLVVAMLAAGAWRLSRGPVATSVFTPAVERFLALQTPGGRARVAHADLVWRAQSETLGLALQGVSLIDRQRRPVLTARRLEFGWAADSILMIRPSLGRVAADDFFAAVSVSPQGRYALGYQAEGAPRGRSDLAGLFGDLTGAERRSRPLSFLRDVELGAGVIDLRQVGAPLAWRARVQRLRFRKADRMLDAAIDLSIGDGPSTAAFKARAHGRTGLGQATAQAWLTGLNPSRIFPSVGAARALSALDAKVAGQATVSYAARIGVKAADIRLTAGEGRARFGAAFEPFHSAEIRAVFDPRAQDIALQRLSLASSRADFDLSGTLRLIPERRRTPASLALSLHGEDGALALSHAGEKQRIRVFAAQGRIIPALRRMEIADARAMIGDATVDTRGAVTAAKAGRSPAIDLDGRLAGAVRTDQLLALWPDGLSHDARQWLVDHVHAGRVGQIVYSLRMPAGAVAPHKPLLNPWVRVGFEVGGGEVRIRKDMPSIVEADGRALLEGDRLHVDLARARLNGVTLAGGKIDLPKLSGPHKSYAARFNADGPLRSIVEVIDAPGGHVLTGQGMQPAKFSGLAQAEISISRPIGPGYGDDFDHYAIAYKGSVKDARLSGIALGADLTSPMVAVEGTQDRLDGRGVGRLGPYRGRLDFASRFIIGRPAERRALLHGVIDLSQADLGGPVGAVMPFDARFESRGDAGQGVINSRGFTGKATWLQGRGGRINVQGRLDAAAWRAIGLPVTRRIEHVAARLDLQKTAAGGWSGALAADAYSGAIALTAGPTPRLRYVAELTPAESRRLGLAGSAFAQPQPMVIDVSAQAGSGGVAYVVGPMKGQVAWRDQGGGHTLYNWRSVLTGDDLHVMGLPASMEPKGPIPMAVTMTGQNGGWTGVAQTTGASLRFAATAPVAGRRTLTFSGPVDSTALNLIGLVPAGIVSGPLGVGGQVGIDERGLAPGHLDIDLTRAALVAPATGYRKAAGRPLKLQADISRSPDGSIQANRLRADGPGVSIDAAVTLHPDSASTVNARAVKVEGVYDGSFVLTADDRGRSITAHGRYFDARALLRDLRQPVPTGGSRTGESGQAKPMRLDLDLDQVKVTDRAVLHGLHATGVWGGSSQRRLDVSAFTPAGSAVSMHLTPDAGGGLVSGRIANVADAAESLMGVSGFAGGQATLQGRLRPEGADLDVEMHDVRLVRAPVLARILTMGSLHGMADTMSGEGVSFQRVVAPMQLRGSQLVIGDARATGRALGLTAKGVIDMDRRTMDVTGAIAPAYSLNSMIGSVPLVGGLLVPRKGEGVFGLTYSAKGTFAQPKVSVNPLSLAAPGILRHMFEGRPTARLEPAPPLPAASPPAP